MIGIMRVQDTYSQESQGDLSLERLNLHVAIITPSRLSRRLRPITTAPTHCSWLNFDSEAQARRLISVIMVEASSSTVNGQNKDGPLEGLFFAGSDDEEDVLMEQPQAETSSSGYTDRKPPRLFFPDSDEDEPRASPFMTPKKRGMSDPGEKEDTSSDIEIPGFDEIPRASSVISTSSSASLQGRDSSPPAPAEILQRPAKKMRVSPAPTTLQASSDASYYLGSFIVGNAWSTVKGKGYIKSGEKINVEREDQDEEASGGTSANGKQSRAPSKGNKKQLSIATMMKFQQPKITKKKTNTVVRLTNTRGFGILSFFFPVKCKLTLGDAEFGRLPTDVASWVSKLLDLGNLIKLLINSL